MLLSKELTSGLEMGCHCLQGDNPFLGSGRSTGSYTSREQRKVGQLRSWGRNSQGQGPHPSASQGHSDPASVLMGQCLYHTGC